MSIFKHYHRWGKWHYEMVDNSHGDLQIVAVRICRRGTCQAEQVRQ